MLWYLIAIAVLLVCSAFFSGSETALFSLSHGQREALKQLRPNASRRIEELLSDPDRLLGTLLLGNLLVNTAVSGLATIVLITVGRLTGAGDALVIGLGGVAVTILLLVFGEVTPKIVASRSPARIAVLVVPSLTPLQWLLRPFARTLTTLASRLAPTKGESDKLTDEEMHTMVELGRRRDVLKGSEDEILLNLIGLDRRAVSEVMTPRIDIVAVPEKATVAEALAVARRSGFSRLPVYHDTIDRVTGTLHVKELLTAPDETASVTAIRRPAHFAPEVKPLPELLDETRRKGSHIAIIVDEFGQTAGLVTLEDLLEAVFGEIVDEYDIAEELPYTKVENDCYLVDGEIDIATLNRLLRNALRGVGHERLSSFIHEKLGRLPKAGDTLRHGRLEITVHETDGTKLEKVVVCRKGK
jgi:CBS domain containing-hemolysin-like protein